MGDTEGSSEQDDVSFLRTEDKVCLSCTATGERVCLAAEGFGNRHCFLENIADKNNPPDLNQCVFVIEQALSVRALQELVTAAGNESDNKESVGKGTGSGHRTLLYGNAILLSHRNSNMYLACLASSSGNDKLAFDVGLQEHSHGEACWWTVHPASKQRSEGEKVRVGDDLILVSVATERYLHTVREGDQTVVNASFHVTHWSVQPYGTGLSAVKFVGSASTEEKLNDSSSFLLASGQQVSFTKPNTESSGNVKKIASPVFTSRRVKKQVDGSEIEHLPTATTTTNTFPSSTSSNAIDSRSLIPKRSSVNSESSQNPSTTSRHSWILSGSSSSSLPPQEDISFPNSNTGKQEEISSTSPLLVPTSDDHDVPSNINLLRKLWSSTRPAKLNLTQEHQSLLRIEPHDQFHSNGSTLTMSTSTPTTTTINDEKQVTTLQPTTTTRESTSTKLVDKIDNDEDENRHKEKIQLTTLSPQHPPPLAFSRSIGKIGRHQMLYPEWLSSAGGIYPDPDDTTTNGTDFYGEAVEPEYDHLIATTNGNENEAQQFVPSANLHDRELLLDEEGYPYPRQRQQQQLLRKRINDDLARGRRGQRRQEIEEEMEEGNTHLLIDMSEKNKQVSTESPSQEQNGLADVISRGRIDSVMYVYFGDQKYNDYHKDEVAGRIIQAVGGVLSAIAQVLTVLGAARCVRQSTQSSSLPVHLHIGFALLLCNLLLILAVHATEPADVCASVALILHYLHLVIGCWLLAHTVQTYRQLCRHVEEPNLLSPDEQNNGEGFRTRPSSIRYCIAAWSSPLPFIMFNTFLVVLSLRHLLALRKLWHDVSGLDPDEDTLDEKLISSEIRASAMLLPLLAIMWFLGVVALENSTSIFFQLSSATANITLSWLVMYFLGDEVWPTEVWCRKSDRRMSSIEVVEPSSASPTSAIQSNT